MSLLTIAELMAGEALVTPGGAVDRLTAISDEPLLWGASAANAPKAAESAQTALVFDEEFEPVLV